MIEILSLASGNVLSQNTINSIHFCENIKIRKRNNLIERKNLALQFSLERFNIKIDVILI